MKKQKILVVGGYGHVGATICKELGELYPGQVYAAGRSMEKAEAFCRETAGKVRPLAFDLRQPPEQELLAEVKLVVMCLDQHDTAFAEQCLLSGTHYIDVSASGAFLTRLEQWGRRSQAKVTGTAVLSIGLAPGLTNLLAAHAHRLLDEVTELDIFIMLGLGDRHGKAAMEWTVDHLCTRYDVTQDHRRVSVESMTDGKLVDFGAKLGKKKAYRFPFSDQQTLAGTLGVASVSTRLCFDQEWVTRAVAAFRRSGICRLLKRPAVRKAVVESFLRWKWGDDLFAIKIEARGKAGNHAAMATCQLQGRDQSYMTAKVAAFAAKTLYSEDFPQGVYHIEQLFKWEQMRAWLPKEADLQVSVSELPR